MLRQRGDFQEQVVSGQWPVVSGFEGPPASASKVQRSLQAEATEGYILP